MFIKIYATWEALLPQLSEILHYRGDIVTTEKWQGIEGVPMLEILQVAFTVLPQPPTYVLPHVSKRWADDHFLERVSGIPFNPPPSHEIWPFGKNKNQVFQKNKKFSHTYPERFWPKLAGVPNGHIVSEETFRFVQPEVLDLLVKEHGHVGIRFKYGDLKDVINLLNKEPKTRQAYLPIWFPEDTGVVHGERVPCSIGYHFIIRDNKLFITYQLRSCDFLLHFEDDMYLALKLQNWVLTHLKNEEIKLGPITVLINNLHCFANQKSSLLTRYK